jgi:hypothetical protein
MTPTVNPPTDRLVPTFPKKVVARLRAHLSVRVALSSIAIVVAASTITLGNRTTAHAADGSAQLSLPSVGNISLTGGPHNWIGCTIINGVLQSDCLLNHPWNSLDWVPSDGQVHASHGGIAHIYDCPSVGGHRSFVRIDYNDGSGYQVSYEHIHNVDLQIADGQSVTRGQYLGNISTDSNCGGSADAAHTHMSLWHFTSGGFAKSNSQAVDMNGMQVGAWVFDDGSSTQEQYTGCISPVAGGTRQCPPAGISNDGTVALSPGNNLLTNSSFEHGTMDPWSFEDLASEGSSLASAGAKDGAAYLEAFTRNASPGHQSIVETLPISISPGRSYTFSVWVRTPDGLSGQVSVDLWAQGNQTEGGATTVTVYGIWTQVAYTLNAQNSNTSLKAQIVMQKVNQNYDFDGAQLVTNSLQNSSFEHATPDPWSLEDSTQEAWHLYSGGAQDGTSYLEAYTTNAIPGHQSIVQTLTIAISPDQSYTFSVWVRGPNQHVVTVSVDLWALGGQAEGGSTTQTLYTVYGAWTQVAYTLNATHSNTSLKAQIIMQTVGQNYDFDGAQLVKNSLTNSGFEHPNPPCGGTDPWTLEDSSQEAWCVKSGGAEDGGSYLEAYTTNATPGHQSIVQTLAISISPGQTYTFSVWVRMPDGLAAQVSVDLWALGNQTDGGGTTVTVAGSWTQVSYTLNTQQWNTSLKVQIIMQTVNRNYDFDGTQI